MEKNTARYLLSTPFGSRLDTLPNITKIIDFMNVYSIVPKDMFFEYKTDKELDEKVNASKGLIKAFYDASEPFIEISPKNPDLLPNIIFNTDSENQQKFVCDILKKVNMPNFSGNCKKIV